jgi:hypothetical protein
MLYINTNLVNCKQLAHDVRWFYYHENYRPSIFDSLKYPLKNCSRELDHDSNIFREPINRFS